MTLALRYPLHLDGAGKAVKTRTDAFVWQDRVSVLLSTIIGERAGDLFYGSDIASAAFDGQQEAFSLVERTVEDAFLRYITGASLESVVVDRDFSNDNTLVVMVTFVLPDGTETSTSTTVDLSATRIA